MLGLLKKSLIALICLTFLTGLLYPLLVTGFAQLLFSDQANGSLIYQDNRLIGSALLGQNFSAPHYFHGRPSAVNYDAAASGGSTLGPTNKKLMEGVQQRIGQIRQENNLATTRTIPSDLVTASGSGLDPDISPASAYLQVERVAKARKLPKAQVQELVGAQIAARQLGILGEPRVNVLKLNLALDKLQSR